MYRLPYESHGGEDVGIYARGPYSHLFTGTIENSYIPHAMGFSLCVGPHKALCLNEQIKNGIGDKSKLRGSKISTRNF